jgi:hypothetical protein
LIAFRNPSFLSSETFFLFHRDHHSIIPLFPFDYLPAEPFIPDSRIAGQAWLGGPIMSKFKIAGLVSWFSSGLLLGFQALEAFIKSGGNMVWKKVTLMDVVGKGRLDWIEDISPGSLHFIVQYIVTMELYLLLFFVGILFFIANSLTTKL